MEGKSNHGTASRFRRGPRYESSDHRRHHAQLARDRLETLVFAAHGLAVSSSRKASGRLTLGGEGETHFHASFGKRETKAPQATSVPPSQKHPRWRYSEMTEKGEVVYSDCVCM